MTVLVREMHFTKQVSSTVFMTTYAVFVGGMVVSIYILYKVPNTMDFSFFLLLRLISSEKQTVWFLVFVHFR